MTQRRVLSLFAVLGVLMAGCSGSSDKPQVLPSITATPVVTSSPAPVPSAARVKTPQGADAFVRFYFQQLNVAFSTSDASIIRAYSEPTCGTCKIYEGALEYSRNNGLRLVGPSFELKDAEASPVAGGTTSVEAFGSIPSKRQVDAQGQTVRSVPEQGDFHFTLTLVAVESSWSVRSITIQST